MDAYEPATAALPRDGTFANDPDSLHLCREPQHDILIIPGPGVGIEFSHHQPDQPGHGSPVFGPAEGAHTVGDMLCHC